MLGDPPLSAGFNRPFRRNAKRLSYRLFSNKRSRLQRLGWPFRRILSSPLLGRISNLYSFWEVHRRLPDFESTGYLNDFLYRVKTSCENLALRKRTSDKALVKVFLEEKLGARYTIPTIAVLDAPGEVDEYRFPANCIVKPTHMSGEIFCCYGDQPSARERDRMKRWFRIDYGRVSNEANYRGLTPRIIVEPFLTLNGSYCFDVRFFVFGGKVTVIEVVSGRYHRPTIDFYDADWNRRTDWRKNGCGHRESGHPRPERLEEMLAICRTIGADFSFVRVDFLTDFASQFYICELTHISGNCRDVISPPAAERFYVDGFTKETTPRTSAAFVESAP